MSEEKKSVRVTITAKQAEQTAAKELIELSRRWLEDGVFEFEEMGQLKARLEKGDIPDTPTFNFLKEELASVLEDGRVDPWELERLHEALLRVLPKKMRDPLKATYIAEKRKKRDAELAAIAASSVKVELDDDYWERVRAEEAEEWSKVPATENQLRYIESLGGEIWPSANKFEASMMIDKLLGKDIRAMAIRVGADPKDLQRRTGCLGVVGIFVAAAWMGDRLL